MYGFLRVKPAGFSFWLTLTRTRAGPVGTGNPTRGSGILRVSHGSNRG